jgi:hypothetical protein
MAPLLLLGLSLLPALTRALAGDRAGEVAATVTAAVREVTGTDDPAAAQAALAANPAAATQLRTRLAEIALDAERLRAESAERERQAALETMRAQLADLAGARGAMVSLAGAGSLIAWGPTLVSFIVTTGFFAMLALFMFWTPGVENQQAWALLNIAVGALVAGFSAVINFWIGSSQGSRDKDETVRRLAGEAMGRASAPAVEAAIAGTLERGRVAMERRLEQAGAALVPAPAPASTPANTPTASAPAATLLDTQAMPRGDARFLTCLATVLRHEGGFVNDPQDPGGATNLGITAATLAAWRGAPVTAEEVRALTEEEAREIYRARYWNRLRCDDLPAGLDLQVFDIGVNAGPGVAAKLLQRAVGVAADGAIGPVTLAAARAADARPAIDRMARLREEHYRGLSGFARFGRGWLRRTDEVRRAAQGMVAA